MCHSMASANGPRLRSGVWVRASKVTRANNTTKCVGRVSHKMAAEHTSERQKETKKKRFVNIRQRHILGTIGQSAYTRAYKLQEHSLSAYKLSEMLLCFAVRAESRKKKRIIFRPPFISAESTKREGRRRCASFLRETNRSGPHKRTTKAAHAYVFVWTHVKKM